MRRRTRVAIYIEDTADETSVKASVCYLNGQQGPDASLAEAVAHDIAAMLAGKPESEFLLEYKGLSKPDRAQLHLIPGGRKR